jgi:nucleotide-binding universal stress UspA family protein
MSPTASDSPTPLSDLRPYDVVLSVLDGSPWAAAAVGVAAQLAERSGGALHLAGAVLPSGARAELGSAAQVAQPGSHEFAEHLEEHVQDVARKARARWSCPVEESMIDTSEPKAGADSTGWGLPEYEAREQVDLTIMGLRPHAPAEGSPSPREAPEGLRSDILKAISTPLLLIPMTDEEITDRESSPTELGKVAVACLPADPGTAREVLRHAARLATVVSSGLCVVGVPPEPMDDIEVIEATDPHDQLPDLLAGGIAGTVALPADRLEIAERVLFQPAAEGRGTEGEERRPVAVLVLPTA